MQLSIPCLFYFIIELKHLEQERVTAKEKLEPSFQVTVWLDCPHQSRLLPEGKGSILLYVIMQFIYVFINSSFQKLLFEFLLCASHIKCFSFKVE